MTFKELINKYKEDNGLSIAGVSVSLKISNRAAQDYLLGEGINPQYNTLVRILGKMGYKIDFIPKHIPSTLDMGKLPKGEMNELYRSH